MKDLCQARCGNALLLASLSQRNSIFVCLHLNTQQVAFERNSSRHRVLNFLVVIGRNPHCLAGDFNGGLGFREVEKALGGGDNAVLTLHFQAIISRLDQLARGKPLVKRVAKFQLPAQSWADCI